MSRPSPHSVLYFVQSMMHMFRYRTLVYFSVGRDFQYSNNKRSFFQGPAQPLT